MEVGIRDLRARLAEVMDRVAGGEVVEITKRGATIARIMRAEPGEPERTSEVLVEATQPARVVYAAEPVPEGQVCKFTDEFGVCGRPATHRHVAQWRCEDH